ncbi:T9SS type A sorting domain-containing protein [Calditrichota bacterium]
MRSVKLQYLSFNVVIIVLFAFQSKANYNYVENASFEQGDASTFIGTVDGDHLYTVYTTNNGYVFIPTIISGKLYYAYATLDNDGWYIPSDSLININQPLPGAYQLDLGEPANTELDEERQDYIDLLQNIHQMYDDIDPEVPLQTEYDVGVFICRFTDDNVWDNDIYSYENFNALLNSDDYVDPNGSEGKHPQNEPVFGSLKQYYYEATLGVIDLNFTIINEDDGVIDWINIGNYSNFENGSDDYHDGTALKTNCNDWLTTNRPGFSLVDDYDYYIFLRQPHIEDFSWPNPDPRHTLCGNSAFNWIIGQDTIRVCRGYTCWSCWPDISSGINPVFAHIGLIAHELGHVLGIITPLGPGCNFMSNYASLMGTGNNCGPGNKGEAPSYLGIQGIHDMFAGRLWEYLEDHSMAEIVNYTEDSGTIALPAVNKYTRDEGVENNFYKVARIVPQYGNEVFYVEARGRHYDHCDYYNGRNYGPHPDNQWALEFEPDENGYFHLVDKGGENDISVVNLYIYHGYDDINEGIHRELDTSVRTLVGEPGGNREFYGYGTANALMPGRQHVMEINPYSAPNTSTKDDDYTGFGIEIFDIDEENFLIQFYYTTDFDGSNFEIDEGEHLRWMYSTFHIKDVIYVRYGGILEIGGDPGWSGDAINVLFSDYAGISVDPGGRIFIHGTNDHGTILRTIIDGEPDNEDPWRGIWIESDEDNQINYTDISGAATAALIVSNEAVLSMNHAEVFENVNGLLSANSSEIEIQNSEFYDNDRNNLKVYNYTDAKIYNSVFTSSGLGNPHYSGCAAITANIYARCSEFTDNNGTGLYGFNGYLCLGPLGEDNWGFNEITGNYGDNLVWSGQVYLSANSYLGMYRGHNTIEEDDEDNPIIGYYEPISFAGLWTYNYWGTTDPEEVEYPRIPPDQTIEPMDEYPWACDYDPIQDPAEDAYFMYSAGMTLENQVEYEEAIDQYQDLISTYPGSYYAALAPGRITFCTQQLSQSFANIRSYFLNVADTTKSEYLEISALNSAAWCLVEMEEYEDAEEEYGDLVETAATFEDSILFEISLVMVEIEELGAGGGFFKVAATGEDKDRLDAAKTRERVIELYNKADELVSSLHKTTPNGNLNLPLEFKLGDPYPNPFNPTVVIPFSLPKESHIEIAIYNILGERIIRLVNEMRLAGEYKELWDGKNLRGDFLASGIYFVKMETSKYNKVKKIVMIK